MFKNLATISVIIFGCSLDASSWGVIGILALVSAVLIGAAVIEECTERARKHPAAAGRKGKVKKNEARRNLRTAG